MRVRSVPFRRVQGDQKWKVRPGRGLATQARWLGVAPCILDLHFGFGFSCGGRWNGSRLEPSPASWICILDLDWRPLDDLAPTDCGATSCLGRGAASWICILDLDWRSKMENTGGRVHSVPFRRVQGDQKWKIWIGGPSARPRLERRPASWICILDLDWRHLVVVWIWIAPQIQVPGWQMPAQLSALVASPLHLHPDEVVPPAIVLAAVAAAAVAPAPHKARAQGPASWTRLLVTAMTASGSSVCIAISVCSIVAPCAAVLHTSSCRRPSSFAPLDLGALLVVPERRRRRLLRRLRRGVVHLSRLQLHVVGNRWRERAMQIQDPNPRCKVPLQV